MFMGKERRDINAKLKELCDLPRPDKGYTFEQIAAHCGCGGGMISRTAKRALLKMKTQLQPFGRR
jgi:DNA-directed RNA polymerase specialized sigma subunit